MLDLAYSATEKLLNKTLSLDPEAQVNLKKLSGKVIKIEVTSLSLTLFMVFDDIQIHLLPNTELDIDTTLSGTLFEWCKLAHQMHNKQMQNAIRIEGYVDTAQNMQRLFQELSIDWEELLSKLLGDSLAHQCCSQAKQLFTWKSQAGKTLKNNLGEYLTEEKRLVLGKSEMDDFCNDVDDLGMAIDRLEQRIKKLEATNEEKQS